MMLKSPNISPARTKRQVNSKYLNCYSCFETLAFNPAFYNVPLSQLFPKQQQYNRTPHCIYLAYFGEKVVKIGIAHARSIPVRWLEQGARAAMVIQMTEDAYQAIALEEQVSQTLDNS